MKNRSRWLLWGILGAVGILAVVLIVVLWVPSLSRVPDDAIFVPRDVPSLQMALDSATPGSTIVIQASADPIQGPISIEVLDITLVSSGGRASLHGAGGEPALSIQADGVTVRGFDLTSESIGLQVNASDCTIEDLQVESTSVGIQINYASRCVLRSSEVRGGGTGVELIGSGSVLAEDLTIVGSSEYGVRLLGSRNNVLRNLILSESAVGISLEEASTDNVLELSSIDSCSIAGIEIRGSSDNLLLGNVLDSVRIGIVLEGVTGTEIRDCQILRPTLSGIFLQQAVQNRIFESRIEESQGTGIQLTQSAENTVLYNQVTDCQEDGIYLINSSKNLIMGNELDDCSIGIHITRSSDTRILRNRVSNSQLCGFFTSLGSFNRLLDNVTVGGAYGMIVAEAGSNTLLRNSLSEAERAGLFLANTLGENHLTENAVQACGWGLVLAASTRDLVTYNRFTGNEVGALLTHMGSGTRIEGNTIADNEIGLLQQMNLAAFEEDLETLGIVLPQVDESAVPILTNNVFTDNADYDIQNESMTNLLAAGNWWGAASVRDPSGAVVSDGVSLEQSAWKGTIAVGTGSDEVRVLLGRILQWTLAEEGFRVIDLVGMGHQERVRQALLDADVDLIWWSGSDLGTQASMEGSASVVLPTPALEGWRIIISAQLASQLTELTASSLGDWYSDTGEQLRYTATSAFGDDSFEAFLAAYELTESVRSFTQADALEEVEALLKFGAVDVAIVGSLKETLTLSGFQAIDDELRILEQDSISMIVQQSISTNYPEIEDVLKALGERLTSEVLHDLVSRIRLLHKEPEVVAREFLQQ
ncbi:NosD domain-containing protein [Candidatus Bipolaricaulota bacterium]